MSCIWPPPPSMPIPPPCILPCTCAPPPDTSPMSPMGPSASEKTNPMGQLFVEKKLLFVDLGKMRGRRARRKTTTDAIDTRTRSLM